eukprot:gene4763-biopygen1404
MAVACRPSGRRVHRRVTPCGAVRRRVAPCGAVCAMCRVQGAVCTAVRRRVAPCAAVCAMCRVQGAVCTAVRRRVTDPPCAPPCDWPCDSFFSQGSVYSKIVVRRAPTEPSAVFQAPGILI